MGAWRRTACSRFLSSRSRSLMRDAIFDSRVKSASRRSGMEASDVRAVPSRTWLDGGAGILWEARLRATAAPDPLPSDTVVVAGGRVKHPGGTRIRREGWTDREIGSIGLV